MHPAQSQSAQVAAAIAEHEGMLKLEAQASVKVGQREGKQARRWVSFPAGPHEWKMKSGLFLFLSFLSSTDPIKTTIAIKFLVHSQQSPLWTKNSSIIDITVESRKVKPRRAIISYEHW